MFGNRPYIIRCSHCHGAIHRDDQANCGYCHANVHNDCKACPHAGGKIGLRNRNDNWMVGVDKQYEHIRKALYAPKHFICAV